MSLRADAEAIWRAGVAAVDSSAAVRRHVLCKNGLLKIADFERPLAEIGHIEVVGAGKAGSGMAIGLESALLPSLSDFNQSHPHRPDVTLSGWINVPADCVRPLQKIHLHSARPAGINEPTADGVMGTTEILRRVRSLGPDDIAVVLLSGGASALLCCPAPGITLADKLAVTRALAADGAPIGELNLVRTQLSDVKGGRLASQCSADTLITLVISDVIGDPLDIIGSGPTVPSASKALQAIEILTRRQLLNSVPESVIRFLRSRTEQTPLTFAGRTMQTTLVASNAIAITAAADKAKELGYQVQSLGDRNAGEAANEGRSLFRKMMAARSELPASPTSSGSRGRLCLLSGGEPTVQLRKPAVHNASETHEQPAKFEPSKGGRNQELVLAAVAAHPHPDDWAGLALLSGGTDGEDGPTDAAGAFADLSLVRHIASSGADPIPYLLRHDAYHFFELTNGLLKTGPTLTNVMDLRVALVSADSA